MGDRPTGSGRATLDASTNSLVNCIETSLSSALYYVFRNLIATGASTLGFEFTSNGDHVLLENCRSTANGFGIRGDNFIALDECEVDNNTNYGVNVDSTLQVYDSEIHDNGAIGIDCEGIVCLDSIFYGNTNQNINQSSSSQLAVVSNCTFDGENAADHGCKFASIIVNVLRNSILYDCDVGVEGSSSVSDRDWET